MGPTKSWDNLSLKRCQKLGLFLVLPSQDPGVLEWAMALVYDASLRGMPICFWEKEAILNSSFNLCIYCLWCNSWSKN